MMKMGTLRMKKNWIDDKQIPIYSMKKTAIILFILFCTIVVHAQKEYKLYFDNNNKYCNEASATRYMLATLQPDGTPVGKVKTYDMQNHVLADEEYSHIDINNKNKNIRHGLCQWVDENKIAHIGNFKNGLADGEDKEFVMDNLTNTWRLFAFGNMTNGKKNGEWKYWYRNENIKEHGNFISDKREGKWTSYWDNKIKQQEATYKNNSLDGKATEYNTDGQLSSTGNYIGGKKEGEWKVYKYGKVHQTEKYVNGELQKRYDEYGKEIAKDWKPVDDYDDVVTDDPSVYRNKSGQNAEKETDPEKVRRIEFQNDLIQRLEKEGGILLKTYYPNGMLKEVGFIVNGKKHGQWFAWYEDATDRYSGQYANDKREGEWFFDWNSEWMGDKYHEYRKFKIRGYYKNGQQTGEWHLSNADYHYSLKKEKGTWKLYYAIDTRLKDDF